MAKLYNLSKIWNTIFKVAIIIIAYGFVVYQFTNDDNIMEVTNRAGNLLHSWLGLVLIVMMLLNWTIDAYKWKYVVRKVEKITLFNAVRATFAGVTTSIFMPFRTGEFVGRIFILKHTKPLKAILMSMISSMSQLIITIFIGTISFLSLIYFDILKYDFLNRWICLLLIVLFVVLLLLTIYLFFNVSEISRRMYKYFDSKGWVKMAVYVRVLMKYSAKELRYLLVLSFFRYVVFTTQYILLLKFFAIDLDYEILFAIISIIYLVMTVIPSVALAEIGVRGSLAVVFITPILHVAGTYVAGVESNIIIAATILWIINLAIPAVIGAWGVIGLKFVRK